MTSPLTMRLEMIGMGKARRILLAMFIAAGVAALQLLTIASTPLECRAYEYCDPHGTFCIPTVQPINCELNGPMCGVC